MTKRAAGPAAAGAEDEVEQPQADISTGHVTSTVAARRSCRSHAVNGAAGKGCMLGAQFWHAANALKIVTRTYEELQEI
jgi:hypothetical protein